MKAINLTIFVTPIVGKEIKLEKTCTLKQAVNLAKKEARKAMKENKSEACFINIQSAGIYGMPETLAHIEAIKKGRRVEFSDEAPAEMYSVCWGSGYQEEDGESNEIATTSDRKEAEGIAKEESETNNCTMSVVRMPEKETVTVFGPETADKVFDRMSETAVNIALAIANTEYIYMRITSPLQKLLNKKASKGVKLSPSILAGCSTMKALVREGIKELKRISYETIRVTTEDRQDVAKYFALQYIDYAVNM